MHYFADRLQAGPLARTYMLGYEQMMRKKSIKLRKYRGHSPSKRQNILIFHQNPLQHSISSLSASHVIIYCGIGVCFCFSTLYKIASKMTLNNCIVLRIETLTGCPLCSESHPLCRLKIKEPYDTCESLPAESLPEKS